MTTKNIVSQGADLIFSEDGTRARIIIPEEDFLTNEFAIKDSGREYARLLLEIGIIDAGGWLSLLRKINAAPRLRESHLIELLSLFTT